MKTSYFDKKEKYYVQFFETPLGEMTAIARKDALVYLRFGHQGIKDGISEETSILKETKKQISEYFEGKRKTFDIPYDVNATEFQKEALEKICEIPYGETRTYGDIAKDLGKRTFARGVGATCRGNTIVIIIPCHRLVMIKEGGQFNYSDGNDRKEYLLELEKKYK